MTNEHLDRVWDAISRVIEGHFGKTSADIPIEEKRDIAKRVAKAIAIIGNTVEPETEQSMKDVPGRH
jgi:hypothetical protein